MKHLLAALQLTGTAVIVALVPSNAVKAVLLPCWWLLTFPRLRTSELILYTIVCAFFTVMDVLSVAQRVFIFDHPDFCGLPLYEPLLWGFYVLHTMRILNVAAPENSFLRAG